MTDQTPPNVIRPATAGKPMFHQEDLDDAAFYQEHKAAILVAVREGRIISRPGQGVRVPADQAAARQRARDAGVPPTKEPK